MFDVTDHLDGLRCRPVSWLRARREELVREQRRLRVEELAVIRVLDERGAFDEATAGRDGVSVRSARETIEMARPLESLPRVAAAAHAGHLSAEQLAPVVLLADETSDAEWAVRAPHVAPADLARLARNREKPTVEESRARREARSLRMWWARSTGMLSVRGELPDLDGARFEATINQLIDRMRPAKGQPWDTREHRGADALLALCEEHGAGEAPVMTPKPVLVVEVPLRGPAEVAGVPLPDAMVEKLRANASIEPVLVDESGVPISIGARSPGLSPKLARAIRLRDQHCRCGNCDRRHGLQIHHLRPAAGAAPMNRRTWRWHVAAVLTTTACSSRTARSRWSATPTSPTASASSTSTTPPTTNAVSSVSRLRPGLLHALEAEPANLGPARLVPDRRRRSGRRSGCRARPPLAAKPQVRWVG